MQIFSAERTSASINQNELQWEGVNKFSRICQDATIVSTKSHVPAFRFIENLSKGLSYVAENKQFPPDRTIVCAVKSP
jgi:hypothetical protein